MGAKAGERSSETETLLCFVLSVGIIGSVLKKKGFTKMLLIIHRSLKRYSGVRAGVGVLMIRWNANDHVSKVEPKESLIRAF